MIRCIVAMDIKEGIAKHGRRPWYIPSDEQYFKTLTMSYGGVVFMGRRTFDLFKRPLPGRSNIVASHTSVANKNVETVTDLPELFSRYKSHKDLWVIGGADIYQQALPYSDELYITKIAADFGCTIFFPSGYESVFQRIEQSEPQTENGFNFTHQVYRRQS